MAKRNSKSLDDRAEEYIGSPRMSHRVRFGTRLAARIDGNYGMYHTRCDMKAKANASCTCPSDYWPCKHVRALELTWQRDPESFVDIEAVLYDLEKKSKVDLLTLLGEIAFSHPASLATLGLEEFVERNEWDEEYDDDEDDEEEFDDDENNDGDFIDTRDATDGDSEHNSLRAMSPDHRL